MEELEPPSPGFGDQCSTAEGWSRDVTEDIAVAVINRVRSEQRLIGKVAQEFLERALGVDAPVGEAG